MSTKQNKPYYIHLIFLFHRVNKTFGISKAMQITTLQMIKYEKQVLKILINRYPQDSKEIIQDIDREE